MRVLGRGGVGWGWECVCGGESVIVIVGEGANVGAKVGCG